VCLHRAAAVEGLEKPNIQVSAHCALLRLLTAASGPVASPHILMGCGNAKRITTYHVSCGNSPVPEWYGNYLYFCARHAWGGISRAYSLQVPGQN